MLGYCRITVLYNTETGLAQSIPKICSPKVTLQKSRVQSVFADRQDSRFTVRPFALQERSYNAGPVGIAIGWATHLPVQHGAGVQTCMQFDGASKKRRLICGR
jgi:hypothetical protein